MTAEAASEVLAANQAFYAAFNARDLTAMVDLWSDSDDVTCIHPGWDVLSGRTLVLESYAAIFGNPSQPKIVAGGESVALAGDAAVVVCHELAGGAPLVATNVFRRETGGWRVVHHQAGQVVARFGD
jgi:ketosteroid isomerase-like protein